MTMVCQYCSKEKKTNMSKVQHELYCQANPDKKIKKSSYGMLGKKKSVGFIVKNQWSNPEYKISDSTREKISKKTSEYNKKKWSDPSNRLKQSEIMRETVQNNPDSYCSRNKGRVKHIEYKGVKLQGSWELDFYKYCESNNIDCQKNTKGFKYYWNGERIYFPDFFIPSYNLFVEVKGYKTQRDQAKWDQFIDPLLIIEKEEIDKIKNNTYNIAIEYARITQSVRVSAS